MGKARIYSRGVESIWRPTRRIAHHAIPERYAVWLFTEESLTDRVVAACGSRFKIRVVSQIWGRPARSEAQALAEDPQRYAWIRQVCLMCGDTPWIYARSVVPRRTLSGRTRRLRYLRTRSLGSVLFSDPSMQRSEFEIASLNPGDPLHTAAAQSLTARPATIWARRAVYQLAGKPLLVTEVFLPGIG